MAPTVSAKAKVRPNSNPKERVMGTPSVSSEMVLEKHKTLKPVGNVSIDTTVSMPATVGRKPFNRYV